ncbi:hypothetical protein ACSFBI_18965 [Variovorax sp. RB3P1]|uniref:hypothetical protein n=1 Tax=Variovorax sp. RB3P1 TaxID=3443732 RepID=UPI003F446454
MGVQDRDWYWKDRAERARVDQAEKAAAIAQHRAARDPEAMIARVNQTAGPKLWGADWHWTIQLLVWLAIVALLAVIWRMTR